jgi:hypothetical protein
MRGRLWCGLLCLLLLAGCNTVAEMRAEEDDAKCQSYGAKPGAPAYVQCRATLDAIRTNDPRNPGLLAPVGAIGSNDPRNPGVLAPDH